MRQQHLLCNATLCLVSISGARSARPGDNGDIIVWRAAAGSRNNASPGTPAVPAVPLLARLLLPAVRRGGLLLLAELLCRIVAIRILSWRPALCQT